MARFGFWGMGFALCWSLNWIAIAAELAQTDFPAAGNHETLLRIQELGRYSLRVEGGRGAAISLVDRMAGPFARAGRVGEENGRLDVLLEPGDYKLRLSGPDRAEGRVRLSVQAFREADSGNPSLLRENQVVETRLEDLNQRSFWVVLDEPGALRLEVMGRDLQHCALWAAGGWLIDLAPTVTVYEPQPGRPMTHIEFHQGLAAGQYRLICYGGPPRAWADENGMHPLYLRLGHRELGLAGIHPLKISPFGREAFLIPGPSNFFEIARAQKEKTRMVLRGFEENGARYGSGRSLTIDKKSREPRGRLLGSAGGQKQWLVIEAEPGAELRFQHFVRREQARFYGNRRYWVSSQHEFAAGESLDITGLIVPSNGERPLAVQMPAVSGGAPLVRQTNLLQPIQMFFQVREEGMYTIASLPDSEARAEFQIEPYLIRKPRDYVASPYQAPGSAWPLTPGHYILNLKPIQKGILSFSLTHAGDRFSPDSPPAPPAAHQVRRGLLWPDIVPGGDQRNPRYIYFNQGPERISTLVVRSLPLDLEEPLSFSLSAGQSVPVEFRVERLANLIVEGADWEIRTAEGLAWNGSPLQPGSYRLILKNNGAQSAWYCLYTEPTPAQTNPSGDQTDFSETLPVLRVGAPYHTDLEPEIWQAVLLEVKEAGLHQIETSGRMATALHVRTRAITELYAANQNGVGRNALVQNYFKPGTYLVNLKAVGKSKGRTAIRLSRTRLIQAPPLELGVVRKQALASGSAVRYPIHIEEAGRYRIQTLGLGKSFAYRLEDGEGWPLTAPGAAGAAEFPLEPGTYHYDSLPDSVAGRRLSSLQRLLPPRAFQGKQPLDIGFNENVNRVWRKGEPDAYSLRVPARVEAAIALSPGMAARVRRNGSPLFEVMGPRGWKGVLEPGDYHFRVHRTEPDDRYPYSFQVITDTLIEGASQRVDAYPARIPISVSGEGLVDILSHGPTDVEARLLDGSGKNQLAFSDDGEHDWNIHISTSLAPGEYLLELTRVGVDYGPTELKLLSRPLSPVAHQGLPFELKSESGAGVTGVPFRMDAEGLLLVETSGGGQPRLSLWRGERLIAETAGRMAVPLHGQTEYRLLAWQAGGGAETFSLHAARAETAIVNLNDAEARLKPKIYYQLENPRRTAYQISDGGVDVLFSPDWERPLTALDSPLVNLYQGRGWLQLQSGRARLGPFRLTPGARLSLELDAPALSFFLDQTGGGPVLVEVETLGAALGVSLTGGSEANRENREWRTMASDKNRLFAAYMGEANPLLEIWRADRSRKPERLSIGLFSFEAASNPSSELGEETNMLEPGTYHAWNLASPVLGVEALLAKGLVAFSMENGRVTALDHALSAHQKAIFSLHGGKLVLLNHGTEAAPYRSRPLLHAPDGGLYAREFPGTFEAVFDQPGLLRFRLPALADGRRLFMRGEGVSPRYRSARGWMRNLEPGTGLECDGGLLEVQHDAGWLSLWTADPASSELAFMGEPPQIEARELSGVGGTLDPGPGRWRFQLDAPRYVEIEADGAGASALLAGGRVLALAAGLDREQRRLSYFLPEGDYEVWTRPLAEFDSRGGIRMESSRPQILTEGVVERPLLIGPGESQAFQFVVREPGKVGVGVVSESDQLEVNLYDESFNPIAGGPLVYGELPTGSYVMVVRAGEHALLYRPKLLGLDGPGSELPEEVRRDYLKAATAPRRPIRTSGTPTAGARPFIPASSQPWDESS